MATNATSTGAGVLRPEVLERITTLERFDAAPGLDAYVENYWTLRWSMPPGESELSSVLPHPSCTLSVERGRTRPGVGADPVVVTGVVTRRFDVDVVGAGWVFAAKFRPGGLAALSGGHARDWQDATVPAVDVLPAPAVSPLRALGPGDTDAHCRAVFDTVLRALVATDAAADDAYRQVLTVVADMLEDRSLISVAEVEARHGISTRRLQRLFARYVGTSPKWVLGRYRMHDAVAELDAGFTGSLADLAARYGWYDQSHFTREFRRLVGVPPAAYVTRERPG